MTAATISNTIPLGGGGSGAGVIVEGRTVEKGKEPFLFWTGVAGHWLETFGTKLESGRGFTDAEIRGVALFLCFIALLASVIPARRATAVDPIVALRVE